MERTEHLLTATSLKALAHPLRVQLLGLLRADGPSTATALGQRVGESSGTTSYHLRQLAAADFVVEDTERGNGRERWWRSAQDSTRLESTKLDDDPETLSAVDAYMGAVARMSAARLDTWIATSRTWPKPWREAGGMSDQLLSLSAGELDRLHAELEAVVESYRRDAKRGDQRVAVHWAAFPVRADG